MNIVALRGAAALLFAATMLAGCGGGAAVGGAAGDGAAFGALSLAITDAPACGYDEVHVTVEKVRLHRSASAAESAAGWQELQVTPPRRIDLLKLGNGVLEELGQATLPAGHYTQLRLVLAENGGSVVPANAVKPTAEATVPLATPSGSQSGLKINVDIVIAPDKRADFVIDFDACRSVVKRGRSGQYGLKPVLSVVPRLSDAGMRVVGQLGGALGAGTQVSLQLAGVPVKATVPAADGSFVLYPVPAGSYDLVVAAPGRAHAVITGVPVLTTAYTFVGSVAGPILLPPSATRSVTGKVTPASATVRTLQTLTGGPTVEVAWVPVDADDGEFGFALPIAATVKAAYVAPPALPVFAADAASAGKYTVEAAITGAKKLQAIDVNAAVPPLNFTLP